MEQHSRATVSSASFPEVKKPEISNQDRAGELIDLIYLEDNERTTIQRVIHADLRLRKTILESLKYNLNKSQQSLTQKTKVVHEWSEQQCACCGKDINMIYVLLFSERCSSCRKLICEDCNTKQKSSLCLSCNNMRILRLQSLNYEVILHYGVKDGTSSEQMHMPILAESELVKKSIQAANRTRQSMELAKGSEIQDRTLSNESPVFRGIKTDYLRRALGNQHRSASLEFPQSVPQKKFVPATPSIATVKANDSSTDRLECQAGTLPRSYYSSKEKKVAFKQRASSDDTEYVPQPKSSMLFHTARVPSIDDPNTGFQLMTKPQEKCLDDQCSVYSEQCYFGVEITGRILLGIWYKAEEKRLYIRIVKAEKLAEAADGALDPYVKTYLLPGIYKSNKRKTGLQYDTTKPVWNEILKYADLTQEEACGRTLWVSVWDWNKYGRQQFLGEVRIQLSKRDLANSADEWFKLQDSESKPSFEPDSLQKTEPRLLVSIMFKPYTREDQTKLRDEKTGMLGCLHVKIRRAENLPAMDVNDRTDSFARCFLLPNNEVNGRKKTEVVENSLNPVWEDEMIYTYLSLEELQCERVLEVTVWDYDRRGTNQFIGGVRIGPNPFDVIHSYDWMDSTDSESIHWEDMLDKPGEWVETWHTLRPSMDSMHELMSLLRITQVSVSSKSLSMGDASEESEQCSPFNPISAIEASKNLEVNISRPKKGNYRISGEILIGIKYMEGSLYVKVTKASDLTAVHPNGLSNPYVKMYLLPDQSKESKKKTSAKRKTLNPVFKEYFVYKVDSADIQNRTLWVTVWDQGSFVTNHFMGETCISMSGDLRHSTERWYELHDFAERGVVVMATPFRHALTHTQQQEQQVGNAPMIAGNEHDNFSDL